MKSIRPRLTAYTPKYTHTHSLTHTYSLAIYAVATHKYFTQFVLRQECIASKNTIIATTTATNKCKTIKKLLVCSYTYLLAYPGSCRLVCNFGKHEFLKTQPSKQLTKLPAC
ncbi:unnamed protein product [Ceratitis capitata]|uniref:(Mediterranean fruit fly) hypothetical protein n=1 Tax=Ceratitis capitata TaxID=7213 RepID=A0A811V2J5_CERCA|nr:unnamed protein product [Ceratitis capitata]